MTISHDALRISFTEYYRDLALPEVELQRCSHEEISILHAIFWLQLQILESGIALGSIVVPGTDKVDDIDDEDHKMEEFELHQLVRLYEKYLSQAKLTVSTTLQDYFSENDSTPQESHIFFDWNILAFIASSLKLPSANTGPVSTESAQLLSVSQANNQDDESSEDAHPFEIVTIGHLRDQLGDMLNVHLDVAARHFLSFLHHLGLLQRLDNGAVLFDGTSNQESLQCCLPLPFGFDISADVETLVACIEACLSDINLTVNELGFLALTRRFWPNGMLSDYTYRRLTKAILGWILSEDNNLAVILRSYVARGRELPGVRTGDFLPWPPQAQDRPTATGAPGNGGDYVATRRSLLSRYVASWMLALHDQSIVNYATMVFDLVTEFAEEQAYWDTSFLGERSEEAIMRHSIVLDARFSMGDLSSLANVNPLQVMTNLATTTKSGYQRGLNWLNLFTSSGVDVPVPIFMQFASLTSKFKPSLADCSILVDAALAACYLRPIGRLELQPIIGLLHEYLSSVILDRIQASENALEVYV
ncbi:hypothetical protein EIP86_004339 [Pleurotus ostreatoroseus]|nr:hypothetical protein EIP86_004339 [Pleurotus ostreatoroseus]